jgi:hypothetical protein
MANRDFKTVQALNRGIKHIALRIKSNGTSAPEIEDGLGATVARVSTGLWRITLADKYVSVLHVGAQVLTATASDEIAQVAAIGTQVIDIRTTSAGSVADLASGDKLTVLIVARNSTVK